MTALATFRRAMRRHEKRARALGCLTTADSIRRTRYGDDTPEAWFRETAHMLRPRPTDRRVKDRDYGRRAAFLYERAADAVAKFRAGLAREAEAEEPPYVCPGCHAVAERCAPGCVEAEIERDRQDEERHRVGDTDYGDDEP